MLQASCRPLVAQILLYLLFVPNLEREVSLLAGSKYIHHRCHFACSAYYIIFVCSTHNSLLKPVEDMLT